MPSAEKALLKAAALEQVVAELQEAASNADKNAVGIAASRDTMERLLARVAGYRARIDKAFEDGTFRDESRNPVYAVFRDVISIVQDSHRSLVSAAAEQIPFAAGIRKSISVAQNLAAREKAVAARAAELEQEETLEISSQEDAVKPLPAAPPPPAPVDEQKSVDAFTESAIEPLPQPPLPVADVMPESAAKPPRKSRRNRAENSG